MAHIYLFRHGQTEFNRDHIFTGHLETPLTPLGLEQAKNLAQMLKDKTINLAYTSNLARNKITLETVLQNHPECQQTIIDDRLLERSYGEFSSHPHAEIIQKFGQAQFDKWHRGWVDKVPNGESYADVEIRIQSFLDDLKSKNYPSSTAIAICGSSNSIRLIRKIMENASITDACSWTIPYDQYFHYEI